MPHPHHHHHHHHHHHRQSSQESALIHDPLKPWRHLLSHSIKIPLIASNFVRALLAISIFGAFSLFYISTFPAANKWWATDCPACDPALIHYPYRHDTLLDDDKTNASALILPANRTDNDQENKTNNISQILPVVVEEEKTNISHILFGIGGSTKTWGVRRQYCELWWKPNVTRGFVWLDKKPTKEWPETSPPYKVSASTTRFKYTNWSGSRSAVRIARILKESFALGMENVRWFVMGDDDTVFFTENLVEMLNRYDHKQMYYIGGNSESVEQNVVHSYNMAYGGGGFAVSYPLAAELVQILDGCIDRYASFYGSDMKIAGCITEIGVPITKEPGFHQMDVRGSPFGILSAHPIAPLISLHHLDYLQPIFPGSTRLKSIKKVVEAYKMDPNRALQHSFCYHPNRKWSVSVSWGYNVQLYPFLLTAKELSTPLQTFLTWGTWSQRPFSFNTRLMKFNPCDRPLIHYFHGANRSHHDTNITSLYKRPLPDRGKLCKKDTYSKAYFVKAFNVTAPLLDPQIWNKGARRQCCEIINGSDKVESVVQVRIRSCNPFESVTPR